MSLSKSFISSFKINKWNSKPTHKNEDASTVNIPEVLVIESSKFIEYTNYNPNLARIKELEILSYSGNQFYGIYNNLRNFSKLKKLTLHSTKVELPMLPDSIEELNLHNANLVANSYNGVALNLKKFWSDNSSGIFPLFFIQNAQEITINTSILKHNENAIEKKNIVFKNLKTLTLCCAMGKKEFANIDYFKLFPVLENINIIIGENIENIDSINQIFLHLGDKLKTINISSECKKHLKVDFSMINQVCKIEIHDKTEKLKIIYPDNQLQNNKYYLDVKDCLTTFLDNIFKNPNLKNITYNLLVTLEDINILNQLTNDQQNHFKEIILKNNINIYIHNNKTFDLKIPSVFFYRGYQIVPVYISDNNIVQKLTYPSDTKAVELAHFNNIRIAEVDLSNCLNLEKVSKINNNVNVITLAIDSDVKSSDIYYNNPNSLVKVQVNLGNSCKVSSITNEEISVKGPFLESFKYCISTLDYAEAIFPLARKIVFEGCDLTNFSFENIPSGVECFEFINCTGNLVINNDNIKFVSADYSNFSFIKLSKNIRTLNIINNINDYVYNENIQEYIMMLNSHINWQNILFYINGYQMETRPLNQDRYAFYRIDFDDRSITSNDESLSMDLAN